MARIKHIHLTIHSNLTYPFALPLRVTTFCIDRAFIFKKRNKNKKGSGGKKKFKWGKKKTKGSSKFASTELPVIEEEEQKREQDVDATGGTVEDTTENRVSGKVIIASSPNAISLINGD